MTTGKADNEKANYEQITECHKLKTYMILEIFVDDNIISCLQSG